MSQNSPCWTRWCQIAVLSVVAVLMALPTHALSAEKSPSLEEQAYAIGTKAYLYAFPMVLMDVTRQVASNIEAGKKIGSGPMNQWNHARVFPDADFTDVVRANVDTLYSSLWADVSSEPLVISVPDAGDRYYMLPMYDMWTDVFAVPGSRITGSQADDYFVSGPGWQGQVPAGMTHIKSPTPYFWIIGRIQTAGPADYPAVHKFQDGLKVTPYSAYGKDAVPAKQEIDPNVDNKTAPIKQVTQMDAATFFGLFAELLKMHAPHGDDYPTLHLMQRYFGFKAGESFEVTKLDPAVQKGLARAVKDGPGRMMQIVKSVNVAPTGWQYFYNGGNYGVNYPLRAVIAMVGLGMNLPEDAVYPIAFIDGNGAPLDGANRYRVHFDKAQLPPAKAFWSLTAYGDDHFFVDNPIDRYAVGSMTDLQYNADGSLDIYVQSDSPGVDKESNWLPVPKTGTFSLLCRLYDPKPSVLQLRWEMPAIEKLE